MPLKEIQVLSFWEHVLFKSKCQLLWWALREFMALCLGIVWRTFCLETFMALERLKGILHRVCKKWMKQKHSQVAWRNNCAYQSLRFGKETEMGGNGEDGRTGFFPLIKVEVIINGIIILAADHKCFHTRWARIIFDFVLGHVRSLTAAFSTSKAH